MNNRCVIMAAMDREYKTIGEWIAGARRELDAIDAELIAVRAFGPRRRSRDRAWLATHLDDEIDDTVRNYAEEMYQKRAAGMPLAYVFGEKEFYGRVFKVTDKTLVPRPETEELIDLIKSLNLSKFARFLEIGTGSGCIAITLALEYPQAYVVATDISMDALAVAVENDVVHEGRVEIVQSDLLADLPLHDGYDEKGENYDPENDEWVFDVVVANLPYVDKNWGWLDKKALSFEPALALYARDKGLALYKRFFGELKRVETSYVVIEADPCQHEELVKIAKKRGYKLLKAQGFGMVFVKALSGY